MTTWGFLLFVFGAFAVLATAGSGFNSLVTAAATFCLAGAVFTGCGIVRDELRRIWPVPKKAKKAKHEKVGRVTEPPLNAPNMGTSGRK